MDVYHLDANLKVYQLDVHSDANFKVYQLDVVHLDAKIRSVRR